MEVAITIWIIGWLVAAGVHAEACDSTGDNDLWVKWGALIPFLILWPHYLGYSASANGKL